MKRLDATYSRFLTQIVGIPYVGRASNTVIYEQTNHFPTRYLLLQRQLLFYGHIVRLLVDDILRCSLLIPNSSRLAHFNFRLRGGPCHEWADRTFEYVAKVGVNPLVVFKELGKIEVKKYVTVLVGERRFFR